jgi:hypothetical protein
LSVNKLLDKCTNCEDIDKNMKSIMLLPVLALACGCSMIAYSHTEAGGEAYKITAISLGSTKSLEDLRLSSTPTSKSLTLGKLNEDQAQTLSAIMEAAIKAAVAAVKP